MGFATSTQKISGPIKSIQGIYYSKSSRTCDCLAKEPATATNTVDLQKFVPDINVGDIYSLLLIDTLTDSKPIQNGLLIAGIALIGLIFVGFLFII